MAKTITLTIDNTKVSVPEGTLVVDAAKKVGVDIPVFCYHPKMEPVGMCRQCLVEIGRPMFDRATGQPVLEADGSPKIQFMPKLETACTNTVSDGMVVLTETERAKAGQKEILELLLTNHPLDCPICDKGGECPLQNLTLEHGSDQSRFNFADKQHQEKNVALGDMIFIDRERCIQCARCIRFQDKIAGDAVLGFYQRGRNTDVVTFSEPGFDSVFSGNTTDICPVGALTTVDFRFGARPWELKNAPSICSQCPVGCNVTYNVRREAKSGGGYVIKRALPRQNEQVNEIWMCDKGRFAGYHYTESPSRLHLDDAEFAANIKKAGELIISAKSDLVVLVGERLTNEDLFNLKSLTAGVKGQIYSYSNMGGGELTASYGLTSGSDLGALGKGDTILVVSSDLYNEAPIWHLRLKAAAQRGATLIVANARDTKLDKFASFVVRFAYGDEVQTVNGLTGKDKIGSAITEAKNLVVFYGSDGLGFDGTNEVANACAALIKNRVGKPNNGLVGVWQSANSQGVWELGIKPATNLADLVKGKVVYLVAADPAGDSPALSEALASAKAVIAQDVLETATTAMATVVLAAQTHTEREGTFTSGERRVQRLYQAVPAHKGTKADFAIAAEIAHACGIELEGKSPMLVMKKIAAVEKTFAKISYEDLAKVTEQWPEVGKGDLYFGGSSYKNTQGLGTHLAYVSNFIKLSEVKTTPRFGEDVVFAVPVTKLFDQGTTVKPAQNLQDRISQARIAMNPATAEKFGLVVGDSVEIKLDGIAYAAIVKMDRSVATGVVLVPRSFGISITKPSAVEILSKQPIHVGGN
jgi:NADH-quinone oxidoreductase subunit G